MQGLRVSVLAVLMLVAASGCGASPEDPVPPEAPQRGEAAPTVDPEALAFFNRLSGRLEIELSERKRSSKSRFPGQITEWWTVGGQNALGHDSVQMRVEVDSERPEGLE